MNNERQKKKILITGVVGVFAIVLVVIGFYLWNTKSDPAEESNATTKQNTVATETPAPTLEPTKQAVKDPSPTAKGEQTETKVTPSVTKTVTVKPVSKNEATPTPKPVVVKKKPTPKPTVKPTKAPSKEYVPISEGWKTSKSVRGDITASQKADLDQMVQSWKSGALTDSQLKEKMEQYLQAQEIDYMEVAVTSKGYTLYDQIPEPGITDGANLYSFFGTYSTGKKNPDGTNKTVCYNWSAFVF